MSLTSTITYWVGGILFQISLKVNLFHVKNLWWQKEKRKKKGPNNSLSRARQHGRIQTSNIDSSNHQNVMQNTRLWYLVICSFFYLSKNLFFFNNGFFFCFFNIYIYIYIILYWFRFERGHRLLIWARWPLLGFG